MWHTVHISEYLLNFDCAAIVRGRKAIVQYVLYMVGNKIWRGQARPTCMVDWIYLPCSRANFGNKNRSDWQYALVLMEKMPRLSGDVWLLVQRILLGTQSINNPPPPTVKLYRPAKPPITETVPTEDVTLVLSGGQKKDTPSPNRVRQRRAHYSPFGLPFVVVGCACREYVSTSFHELVPSDIAGSAPPPRNFPR